MAVLSAWIKELGGADTQFLFPTARGDRMSADAVQRMLQRQFWAPPPSKRFSIYTGFPVMSICEATNRCLPAGRRRMTSPSSSGPA